MIVKAHPPRMTPEQFEELPDDQGLELIEGIVQEKKVGTENGVIQSRLNYYLNSVVLPASLGVVLDAEGMYQCFPNRRRTVRKSDISFLLRDRLPGGLVPRGICKVRPDLAVEVVSPNDTYEEVEEKLADYFDAGVRLVWLVFPALRIARVHRPDRTITELAENELLNGETVLPGFQVLVSELFPVRPVPAPPAGP